MSANCIYLKYLSKLDSRRVGRNDPVLRIPLMVDDVYLVHGAKNIVEAFKAKSLSVTWHMGFMLTRWFGMSGHAAGIYYKDTSGPGKKPNLGSMTKPSGRVYYQTHETLLDGLLRQGLEPMTNRLEVEIRTSISSLQISDHWTEFPDLLKFYKHFLGTAVIKTVFGSTILSLNPDFVQVLWDYDEVILSLSNPIPILSAPKAYWLRRKLLQYIKRWHAYARAHSTGYESHGNQDGDPYWGCKMMRDRYVTLCDTEDQDHDSVAATDLALFWTYDDLAGILQAC